MSQDVANATDYYTQVASEFDQSYTHDPNRIERLQVWDSFLGRYANGARLAYDLGCGTGAVTLRLARCAQQVIGIDGASGMLAIARQHAGKQGLADRVQFIERSLPVSGDPKLDPADLVISSSAIEYMDSIPEALAFVHRILKPSGTLIFSMSNRASLSRKLVRLVHRLTGKPEYLAHLRHFVTVAELERHLSAAGFSPIEHAYFGGADRMNRILGSMLPTRRASNMIIVVARRGA